MIIFTLYEYSLTSKSASALEGLSYPSRPYALLLVLNSTRRVYRHATACRCYAHWEVRSTTLVACLVKSVYTFTEGQSRPSEKCKHF